MSDCATCLTIAKKGIYIRIHVQPAARQEGFRGIYGNAIKIATRAAPQNGKANIAIALLLANSLNVAKSDVRIVAGHKSRSKRFFIAGNAKVLAKAVETAFNHQYLRQSC